MIGQMFTVGGEDLKLHDVPYNWLQSVRCMLVHCTLFSFTTAENSSGHMDHCMNLNRKIYALNLNNTNLRLPHWLVSKVDNLEINVQ